MRIGNKEFDTENHTNIMGILNVTPDSFSDGGKYNHLDAALYHAEEMIKDGADILDVGGESTRPGHVQITEAEEIERIVPVVGKLCARFDTPISIDTYKSSVAQAALQAGAALVNDIWGLKYDAAMAGLIAKSEACCCLMHNREKASYQNFLQDVLTDLGKSVDIARRAGIQKERIILDPGVGFGKNYEMNLEIIKELHSLAHLGYPILLGTSRKSVVGLALDLPANEREEGTLATTVIGCVKGCAFVRVHDVKSNKRAIQMTEEVMRIHQHSSSM